MSSQNVGTKKQNRGIISLVASVVIGVTLLASGTGKILASGEVSAQVLDFIVDVTPEVFITPATIHFLGNILVPHIIPWLEFILGSCLIIGLAPRLIAVLCLPLLAAFLGTNLWAMGRGGYVTCANCFGIWEEIFGALTSVQALAYDLILLAFAIMVITFHPGKFFSSRPWLANLGKQQRLDATTLKRKVLESGSYLRNSAVKASTYLGAIGRKARQHPGIALLAGICLLGLATYGTISAFVTTPAPQDTTVDIPLVSDIYVEVSETGAVISWTTDRPTISSVQTYTKQGILTITVTDKSPVTTHRILIGGLSAGTTYYFKVLHDDGQALTKEKSFTTLAAAPSSLSISDVRIAEMTDSSVTITWVTNRPATSELEYWVSGSTERHTISRSELVTHHSVKLTMLQTDAVYHYRARSTDASGSQVTWEAEKSFTLAIGPEVGRRAPDFTLTTLDGRTVTLSDYRGKLVMLDFWAWSCSACRQKMPIIQQAAGRIPSEKAVILAVHFEGRKSVIQSYVLSEGLTFPVLLDIGGTVSQLYNVTALPTVFFIDANGIIRAIDPTFHTAEELENIFSSLLTAD